MRIFVVVRRRIFIWILRAQYLWAGGQIYRLTPLLYPGHTLIEKSSISFMKSGLWTGVRIVSDLMGLVDPDSEYGLRPRKVPM
jgi:hypothetical protein